MSIPTYEELMLPLLQLASAGSASDLPSAEEQLGGLFALSKEQRETRLPSGQQTVLRNRAGWASFYLKNAGLLAKPRRGYFEITQRGRDVLAAKPEKIDRAFLMQFPEFVGFLASSPSGIGTVIPTQTNGSEQTPDERLQVAYQALRSELASQVLERLLAATPEFFEGVVVELLVAMGYGGSRRDAGERLGKTGDGGIDGIIKEDRLGLDVILGLNNQVQHVLRKYPVPRPLLRGAFSSPAFSLVCR